MAEASSGLHKVLSLPAIYRLFQDLTGAKAGRQRVVSEYLKPRPGTTILDLGCGPADYFAVMPDVDYTGVDLSDAYIAAARERFGAKGRFAVGDVTRLSFPASQNFDLILAAGLVHHLSDQQAQALYSSAGKLLAPGGRMVTIDPSFVDGQSPIARYLIGQDRGHFVRKPEQYRDLAQEIFPAPTVHIRHDLLRIPYTHCILECRRAP